MTYVKNKDDVCIENMEMLTDFTQIQKTEKANYVLIKAYLMLLRRFKIIKSEFKRFLCWVFFY